MPEPAISILVIRGQRVILDADLARLYGVRTGALNQAVKRNGERFPVDFIFQLSIEEMEALRCQPDTSKATGGKASQIVIPKPQPKNRSQIVTGSQKHRDPRYLPHVFTEHGALQASNVLSSPEAVKMSLYVIRAFVKIREELTANSAILKRLAEIDKTLFVHDQALRDLYGKLRPLLTPPPDPPKRRIGFNPESD